jgi:hypothetical protein
MKFEQLLFEQLSHAVACDSVSESLLIEYQLSPTPLTASVRRVASHIRLPKSIFNQQLPVARASDSIASRPCSLSLREKQRGSATAFNYTLPPSKRQPFPTNFLSVETALLALPARISGHKLRHYRRANNHKRTLPTLQPHYQRKFPLSQEHNGINSKLLGKNADQPAMPGIRAPTARLSDRAQH